MVFGSVKEDNEVLCEKVSDVLHTIGKKPRMDVYRR